VVWVPPEEAPVRRNPSRQTIQAFLESALADGAVPVRELEAKAPAAMLLAPDLPISQCKPFRRAADDLHVLRFRDDDRWFWELPKTGGQDAHKMPASTDCGRSGCEGGGIRSFFRCILQPRGKIPWPARRSDGDSVQSPRARQQAQRSAGSKVTLKMSAEDHARLKDYIDNDVRISGCADIAQVSDPWLAGMHG
jgi:hypothetical protein